MGYFIKMIDEVDEKLFEPLGAHRRMEMRNGDSLVIDEEKGNYILRFSEKMYIPENVRSDEKIPHSDLSYFIIHCFGRFLGIETLVIRHDEILHSGDVSRTMTFSSLTIYSPYRIAGLEQKLVDECENMLMINFKTRVDRINKSDPNLPMVTLIGSVMEHPKFKEVNGIDDL